jgi:hypothetical protein
VDVSAVRAEIKDVLQAALTGWRVESYLPESPNPPCLLVGYPTDIVYNATLRAHARITMPIMVLVGAADARSAQLRMDEALGTDSGSVVDALHGTSGTAWFGPIIVKSAGNVGRAVTDGGAQLFAADIVIEFLA